MAKEKETAGKEPDVTQNLIGAEGAQAAERAEEAAAVAEGEAAVAEGAAEGAQMSARDAYRNRIKEDYPDLDIDDEEAYYQAANKRYDDYKTMRGGIESLNAMIDKNSLFRDMMVAASNGGEDWNPIKWLVEERGLDLSALAEDKEYADKFADAQRKHLKEVADGEALKKEGAENYQASMQAINEYCQQNGISDEQKNQTWERVYQMLNDANVGKVSTDIFALLVQGENHDRDVAQATEEGRQEGLSTKISDKLRKVKAPERSTGMQRPEPQPKPTPKSNNMFMA